MNARMSKFNNIILCSGHLIDTNDRPTPRFPKEKEAIVREQIFQQLKAWNITKGDLAICGGARGADIIFAELCLDLGVDVWLFIAMPERDFLEASVRLPGGDWEARFYKLRNNPGVKTFIEEDVLHKEFVFADANIRMMDSAIAQAKDPANLHAVLVWDEKPSGDGPGGTADFAAKIKLLGGKLAIINPTSLS